MHGNIFTAKCIKCCYKGDTNVGMDILPLWLLCKNILKPGVALFREILPKKEWINAIETISSCDSMFIKGTSLNVVLRIPCHCILRIIMSS